MEHCLKIGLPDSMTGILEDSDSNSQRTKNTDSPCDDLDSLLASNTGTEDDFLAKCTPINLEDYDTTLFYDTLASDIETIDEGSVEGEAEVTRPMADQWSETTYATVLRQHVNRTHTSFHNSVPVVKSIKYDSLKFEPERRENGLLRSQLEIRVNNGVPENSRTIYVTEHKQPILERKIEPNRQIVPNITTMESISSETIYSTDTFATNQPPRTYIDRLVQGSVDDFRNKPLTMVTQSSSVHQTSRSPPMDIVKIDQESTVTVSQKNPSPPADSERISMSADSQGIVESSDASLFQNTEPFSINPQQIYDKTRCFACQKVVYPLEGLRIMDRVFHKSCFRCHKCQRILSVRTFNVGEGHPYCEPHYVELFRVRGRYGVTARGKSVEDDEDFLLHQIAVQSSTPAETAKDRPPPLVTRTLIAKFQQMSNLSKSSQDVRREQSMAVRPMSHSSNETTRDVHTKCLSFMRNPIPTPFLQASNLQISERSPSAQRSPDQTPEDNALCSCTKSNEDHEFPYPGTAKDLIAMFSTLSTG